MGKKQAYYSVMEKLLAFVKESYEFDNAITFNEMLELATVDGVVCHQAICDVVNGEAREQGLVDNGFDMVAPSWVRKDADGEPMMPWDSELVYEKGVFIWTGADGPSGGEHMTISIEVQPTDQFRLF